jgi:hypothetical protein
VLQLLRHGVSVFKVIYEKPVLITSKVCVLGEGAIITYFNDLGLTRPVRAGLELTTPRMLSKSSTTRLPQPVSIPYQIYPPLNPKYFRNNGAFVDDASLNVANSFKLDQIMWARRIGEGHHNWRRTFYIRHYTHSPSSSEPINQFQIALL